MLILYCTVPGRGRVPDLSDKDEYEYNGARVRNCTMRKVIDSNFQTTL